MLHRPPCWASLCHIRRTAVLHVVWFYTSRLSLSGADVVVNGSPPHSHGVHSKKKKKKNQADGLSIWCSLVDAELSVPGISPNSDELEVRSTEARFRGPASRPLGKDPGSTSRDPPELMIKDSRSNYSHRCGTLGDASWPQATSNCAGTSLVPSLGPGLQPIVAAANAKVLRHCLQSVVAAADLYCQKKARQA